MAQRQVRGDGGPPDHDAGSGGRALKVDAVVEGLLRELAPQVLGRLVRRHGQFDLCEDAVQEALLAAAAQWTGDGLPASPAGWLHRVAERRLIDGQRSEHARRRREERVARQAPDVEPAADDAPGPAADDTLGLLFLCCHPSLSATSQVALTLRAVGGLTTAEVARAFLVPEGAMARRISRAKQAVTAAGRPFEVLGDGDRADRTAAVLRVLYLVFNEGYTASSGPQLHRVDLSTEAIRLTRMLHGLTPDDGEVAGLLALMLLTDARRAARVGADGELIPLAEQDRTRYDRALIGRAVALLDDTLPHGRVGPYQLQAAIAALHCEAPSAEATDWPQVLALYTLLQRLEPTPMVALNRAVAVAMVHGAGPALRLLDELAADGTIGGHHRYHAVRAHVLELGGDHDAARDSYERAAQRAVSLPEQDYLRRKARRRPSRSPGARSDDGGP